MLFLFLFLFSVKLSLVGALQMHAILNEIVFGGQVLETSSEEVMRAVEEITRYSPSHSYT